MSNSFWKVVSHSWFFFSPYQAIHKQILILYCHASEHTNLKNKITHHGKSFSDHREDPNGGGWIGKRVCRYRNHNQLKVGPFQPVLLSQTITHFYLLKNQLLGIPWLFCILLINTHYSIFCWYHVLCFVEYFSCVRYNFMWKTIHWKRKRDM